MALSVVDLYQKVLPKTNCGDCGWATCLAFASMVVSEKVPLSRCPHLTAEVVARFQPELDRQHAEGRWTKKDMARDAMQWARQRSASMHLEDLPARIGGRLETRVGQTVLVLPYFHDTVCISSERIWKQDGSELNRWEQVFIYNHIAQGGSRPPGDGWLGLEQIPNTVSKIKSMRAHVEAPLIACFRGKTTQLLTAARRLGAEDLTVDEPSADAVLLFRPLPKVPVKLLFWDAQPEDGFDAQVKLLFNETIREHLDIESIMFLSERIRQLLCGED
jgi:hypothetical protein